MYLFDPYYFVLGLLFGLFYTYLNSTDPEVIYKYPNPDNVGKIIYQDKSGVCYKYRMESTECPTDHNLMKPQPIQQ